MKIFTDEFENLLVNVIGTTIVVSIVLVIISLFGWVEVGM